MGSDAGDDVRAKARLDFLATMYKAMWDNINRHVTIMWQSVGLLATAFAATFFLKGESGGDRGPMLDVITSVVVIASLWVVAQAHDASEWCNRNLQIISNIERELLDSDDVFRIHPYAGQKRKNKLLGYFRIQVTLSISLMVLAVLMHFLLRVGDQLSFSNPISPIKLLPYVVLAAGTAWVWSERNSTRSSFDRFQARLANSASPDHPVHGNP
jgi:hypothetical protein